VAAGPWPGFAPVSLVWRLPIALAGLALGWHGGRRLRWLAVAVIAAALVQDAVVPALRDAAAVAATSSTTVQALQRRLGELAARAEVLEVLAGGGAEAQPERAFTLLARHAGAVTADAEALVLIDGRGNPVAWHGTRPRLPLRLRTLGDRTVVAEPGPSGVSLWWREPVLDAGRQAGALLVGAELPEAGARRALGADAGRAGAIVPLLAGGATVAGPGGARVIGLAVEPERPVWWATEALAAVVIALAIALAAGPPARAGLLAAVAAWLLFAQPTWPPWWLALASLAAAAALAALPGRAARIAGAAVLAGVGALLPGVVGELGLELVPASVLRPGAALVVVLVALTVLVRSAAGGGARLAAPLHLLAWLPVVVGLARADARLLGVGAALVVLAGLPARPVVSAALLGAVLLVGGHDAARVRRVVGSVESTVALLEGAEGPARALLTSLPSPGLAELVRLAPPERLVVLGRLAGWTSFSATLPGASLALLDPSDEAVSVWGELPGIVGGAPRELAGREIGGGWRIAVLAPPPPYHLLAALLERGAGGAVAAFDRAGAPTGRGAVFQPLTPARVGMALAAQRGWGRVGVGERTFRAYLRAHGEAVFAVPLLRQPVAELVLVTAALALCGALPLLAWQHRRRLSERWQRRHTFAGRVETVLLATALVPVLLLALLLSQQWSRQRERARLELGRAIGRPISDPTGWDRALPAVVRDMGGTAVLYRAGALVWCTRPDLAASGAVPRLPPAEAYVRAVRGWREPLVTGRDVTDVYATLESAPEPAVAAALGVRVSGLGAGPSPAEWLAVMGTIAVLVALAAAGALGRRLAGPLGRLAAGARRLERGERLPPMAIEGDEDVAALGRAFVGMAETVQRREEELRRERDLLERILGTLSAAVIVCDASGTVELANPAARALLGGVDTAAGLARRFGPAVAGLIGRAGSGENAETTLQPAGASETLWRATVQPLTGSEGRVLLVLEDLSEVARAQRLASVADAARIVAHEVKNPLTPIRLWAEELQAAAARGAEATVEVARLAAAEILERVAHLREVAQAFSNLVALERWQAERVDPAAVAREVAAEYAVLGQRGVDVTVSAGAPCAISIDPTWLRRALRHLLENSVRAIGDRRGRVAVSVGPRDGEVDVVIADSGGGVPEGHLAWLFEPHFSTTSEGSGLGLALVRRIVARAGGRAEARNAGAGLEVTLVFPAAL
jgi:signal transduction histidine kinase